MSTLTDTGFLSAVPDADDALHEKCTKAYDEESGLMEKDGILILHTRIAEDVSEIIADHREKRIAEIIG